MSRRSESYIGTYWVDSAGDMLEVEKIRDVVKVINKHNKRKEERALYRFENGYSKQPPQKLPRMRVKLQGRGPRKEAAVKDGTYYHAYDQSLPLRHAKKVDLYIYERSELYV
tara:strand:+ start:1638 stop:1973 length:336 start_codon:yes stop_codon:yes gene_type:complete